MIKILLTISLLLSSFVAAQENKYEPVANKAEYYALKYLPGKDYSDLKDWVLENQKKVLSKTDAYDNFEVVLFTPQFGSDLKEVASQLDIEKAIGVGHSMGGYCVTEVAYLSPDVFSDLVLVDPVIRPPDAYDSRTAVPHGSVEDHPIARRRSQFESWVEMYDRYEQRSPYSLWRRQVFEDYCRHGVNPAKEGSGVELACPGAVEASIYMGNNESSIHEFIPKIAPIMID